MRTFKAELAALLTLAIVTVACGDTTGGSSGNTSTTFEGVIAGDSTSGLLSGKLSLTISATTLDIAAPALLLDRTGVTASVGVTGTLTLVGGTVITLTGTYDSDAHTLSIAGGGYRFTGAFTAGVLSGTFTTPGGGSGSFTTSSPGSGAVYSFCGNAVATSGIAGAGATFNMQINTGTGVLTGFAIGNHDRGTTTLTGTAANSSWSLSFREINHGNPGSASGTYTATTLSGTYAIPGNGEAGTVTGVLCH